MHQIWYDTQCHTSLPSSTQSNGIAQEWIVLADRDKQRHLGKTIKICDLSGDAYGCAPFLLISTILYWTCLSDLGYHGRSSESSPSTRQSQNNGSPMTADRAADHKYPRTPRGREFSIPSNFISWKFL